MPGRATLDGSALVRGMHPRRLSRSYRYCGPRNVCFFATGASLPWRYAYPSGRPPRTRCRSREKRREEMREAGSLDEAEPGRRLDAEDKDPADKDSDIAGWRMNAHRVDPGKAPCLGAPLRPSRDSQCAYSLCEVHCAKSRREKAQRIASGHAGRWMKCCSAVVAETGS